MTSRRDRTYDELPAQHPISACVETILPHAAECDFHFTEMREDLGFFPDVSSRHREFVELLLSMKSCVSDYCLARWSS